MTKQELLDKAIAGLAAQGYMRCKDVWGCLYWRADGSRCAVGHLLSEDLAKEAACNHWGSVYFMAPENYQALCREIGAVDSRFLNSLQLAHDMGHTPDQMRKNLKGLAERYGLECAL